MSEQAVPRVPFDVALAEFEAAAMRVAAFSVAEFERHAVEVNAVWDRIEAAMDREDGADD